MRKILKITAYVLALIIIVLAVCLKRNDTTPYLKSDYFRETCRRADSVRQNAFALTDTLFAGFSSISITPDIGSSPSSSKDGKFSSVPMAGYGDRKGKPSTGIHDSIFVKAAALQESGKMIILVGTDLLIMPPNITDSVAVILRSHGIRRDQLFFTATHSHSSLGGWGPGYIGELFAGKENKDLEKWIAQKTAAAVLSAISDLKPAKAASGSFNAAAYTRNRVTGEGGTKNDEFIYILLDQANGKKAVIGSFSAHSTTLGDENMKISADYPGYWERAIEGNGYDYAIFCAGSVGSQSPVGKGEGFEKAAFIGSSLADSTLRRLGSSSGSYMTRFSFAAVPLKLPPYHIRLTTSISLASFISRKLMQEPSSVFIQAFRLDKLVWLTMPGDFSGEIGRQLKLELASQGFLSNISSFNGSYAGYIIPGKYYYLDEYESKMMGWFGQTMGDFMTDMAGRTVKIVTN
jgi:neutral ceramidase